jgi:hypothetical protein
MEGAALLSAAPLATTGFSTDRSLQSALEESHCRTPCVFEEGLLQTRLHVGPYLSFYVSLPWRSWYRCGLDFVCHCGLTATGAVKSVQRRCVSTGWALGVSISPNLHHGFAHQDPDAWHGPEHISKYATKGHLFLLKLQSRGPDILQLARTSRNKPDMPGTHQVRRDNSHFPSSHGSPELPADRTMQLKACVRQDTRISLLHRLIEVRPFPCSPPAVLGSTAEEPCRWGCLTPAPGGWGASGSKQRVVCVSSERCPECTEKGAGG